MTDSQQQSSTATTSSSSTQPEAPVTSYSQLNGPTPSNQAAQTMLPQASVSVPVQNGKKRKRLQKACSACHTAKRRCSGGLPCSNCAFAGKTCRYTDSNGNAVAPPPCNPVDQPMQAAWQQQHQQQQQQQQQHQNAPSPPTQYVIQSTPFPPSQVVYSSQMSRSRAMTGSSSYGSPHTSGPLSPAQDLSSWITAERRRALLNVFFSKLHPYNSIIDELTFTRDLASDDVSPILLLSILALSAPQEENPTPSTSTSRSSSGEEFGRIARNFLFEEDYHGNTALDSPNVEIAQSLAFLSIHELSLGRLSRASLLIGNALRIVSSLRLQEGYIPSSSSTSKTSSSTSSNIKRATCIRTACLITILEVLISILSGQSPVSQISDIEILTYMSLPDSLTCSFVRLTSSVTLLSQVISAEKSSSRSNLTNGGSHSRSLSARSEADGLLRNLQSTLPFEEVFNPRNRQLNANELNNSDNGGDGESKMKSWCWTMMHSMYCISQIILEKGINSTSNSAHENLIDLLSTLGSEGRRSLIVRLPLMVASKWSRPPKPVSDWFMESNAVWGSNERNVENSLSILGLLNVNVNLGVNGGQVGSSPSNSPPISIRPLSSNTTTSPKLPPLIKSHSMNGNLPHHHHPYALHHGHSRSISNNSNPNHFLHPNSPPSLPSLRISQPDQQQTSSSSSTSQRMHSFSPGPTRPTSSSEITSPTSEIVPALSESSSTSSSTSSSSNGMNYSLSQSHQPIGTQNSTPRSMIMIEKRPNSTSPPPPFKSNTNSSNSSFGSLLHPSNDKWSPLPPLIVRGKESNVRT